jgi:hypothetical protein
MSNTLMIGLGIVAVGTLAGLIGTLTDTANKAGLKVFLMLLVLGAGIAGAYTEIQREEAAKSEKKRSEEALRMADESRQMAQEGFLNMDLAKQQAEKEKADLIAKVGRRTTIAKSLAEELFPLLANVDEIEQAAKKARKKDIAELAGQARLEISKMLLKDSKSAQWLNESQTSKLEKLIKKETPFSADELKLILDALNKDLD